MTKNTRMTKQKQVILDVLRSTKSHPTADWIYEQARKQLPNLSLGTVYRNLGVLKDMGELLELNYGSTYSRFDGNPVNHYHFVCLNCHKVLDIEMDVEERLNNKVEEVMGCHVKHHRLEVYGTCPQCLCKN
ncbi:MAG: transcriptional repressor [Clostridia bacterium]|nr:transcriptional repressor [Clostridia bacterium]